MVVVVVVSRVVYIYVYISCYSGGYLLRYHSIMPNQSPLPYSECTVYLPIGMYTTNQCTLLFPWYVYAMFVYIMCISIMCTSCKYLFLHV